MQAGWTVWKTSFAPATEKLHILRVIIDPLAPDSALSAIAVGDDGSRTCFTSDLGESKDALCKRVSAAMGWEVMGLIRRWQGRSATAL